MNVEHLHIEWVMSSMLQRWFPSAFIISAKEPERKSSWSNTAYNNDNFRAFMHYLRDLFAVKKSVFIN